MSSDNAQSGHLTEMLKTQQRNVRRDSYEEITINRLRWWENCSCGRQQDIMNHIRQGYRKVLESRMGRGGYGKNGFYSSLVTCLVQT